MIGIDVHVEVHRLRVTDASSWERVNEKVRCFCPLGLTRCLGVHLDSLSTSCGEVVVCQSDQYSAMYVRPSLCLMKLFLLLTYRGKTGSYPAGRAGISIRNKS